MNEIATYEKEGVIKTSLETLEGFIFIHLDLPKLTPELVKRLREEFEQVLDLLQSRGHDVVFATGSSEKAVKLWQTIKPCFEVVKICEGEDEIWLGSWLTFKEE